MPRSDKMPPGKPEPSDAEQRKADEEAKALAETKDFLADGGDANALTSLGWPLLVEAAQYGHLSVVAFLIARGADVSATDPSGETALHAAAKCGHTRVVEFLIDQGADVNRRDNQGRTPLHAAIGWRQETETAALLISRGADVNAVDDDDETPLHKAAFIGRESLVELLIANGADPNAGPKGYAPLSTEGATPSTAP